MSLTSLEQSQVRFYLGHPTIFRYLEPRLEGLWAALDSDAETLVRSILGQLAAVDAKLYGTAGALGQAGEAAGVKAVEEIQFATGTSVTTGLRQLGRGLVARLSTILGVPVRTDVYGEAGWGGDSYSDFGGWGGNGRNGIPLG